MEATQSSEAASQRRSERRSSPPGPETALSRSDGDLAGVMEAYLQVFSRPPLGDHPQMDGFVAGRVLAEEYPDEMQRVMSGIRAGIKEGTESAAEAGGQTGG